jgi:DNA sulfur modification protein DndD
MLIRSITLENFLPFKGKQEIHFSVDPVKNVTVIKGDNGAGKTSIAQAFEWCLYGEVAYSDKRILNAYVRDHISPGSYTYASVELKINQDGTTYIISRSQKYARKLNGDMAKPETPEFNILYKSDGETHTVGVGDQKATINKLLSNQLSKYFFFDGEHMKNMRAEIEGGKKSEDFAEAVKTILGLQPIDNAMSHLKSSGQRRSVERTFRSQYSVEGDETLRHDTQRISYLEKRNAELDETIEDAIADQQTAKGYENKWQQLLDENKKSEEAMKAVRKASSRLDAARTDYNSRLDGVFRTFRKEQYGYFAKKLIEEAQEELKDQDLESKGIPQVNNKTIEFLLKRHKCICGTEFEDGDDIAKNLYKMLDFVPPKDIGTYISEFNHECEVRSETDNSLYEDVSHAYMEFRNSSKRLTEAEKQLKSAQAELDGINNVDVGNLRNNLRKAQQDYHESISKQSVAQSEKTRNTSEILRLQKEIDSISVRSEKNKEIAKCIDYTDFIYNYLKTYYSKKEAETRAELEKTVNKYFQRIYEGDFTLELNESYGVTVRVADINTSDEVWKTSGGQTLSVILSFILGVLDIAKKNISEEGDLLQGSTYPLVMDAPLSDFDKTRIKTICSVLPEVAEQVIIIIKDTDGDLAEQYMANRIGQRCEIEKIRDFDSVVHAD